MVTFPSASTKIGPVVIGVTSVFVVVTATRLRCRSITLPATGVVPEANGAAGVPKVSSVAMI
jgi:hypothetical protein